MQCGTAIAHLTNFPSGWTPKGQTLLWAYITMAVFLIAILFSRVIYTFIERFMTFIAVITVVGLIWASSSKDVIHLIPEFIKGLIMPVKPFPRPWDPGDATKLLTAITFAGLGGFWTLFYSYWLRDKGAGMGGRIGRITGLTGKPEAIPDSGFVPEDESEGEREFRNWKRYLVIDSGVGIFGNIFTTLMTCLLAYALLFPKGLLPQGYEIAVIQSRFFEVSWGWIGRITFLIVAAAFLSDTWIATIDAVSRIQADILHSLFPATRRYSVRLLYYVFLGLFTVITAVTMLFDAPGPLILLTAVIGFAGTVIFTGAIILLNHRYLPRFVPEWARPRRRLQVLITITFISYLMLAIGYIYLKFQQ